MKVYFISGLAADSRVFKNIQLPAHCEAVHLDWIKPLRREPLKAYALRMAESINVNEPFAIIGLSMGGMITTEIARQYKPVATILISSIPASTELPFYFKAARVLKLYKIVPVQLVKSAALLKRAFTTETPAEKDILRAIIRDSDNAFIYWAMEAILHWKNDTRPDSYIHIHGTKDEVLPIRFTKPSHTISKGGHLMIMTKAREINRILKEVLPA